MGGAAGDAKKDAEKDEKASMAAELEKATKDSLWLIDSQTNPVVGHMFDTGEDSPSPITFKKEIKPAVMALLEASGPITVADMIKAVPEADKDDVLAFVAILLAK